MRGVVDEEEEKQRKAGVIFSHANVWKHLILSMVWQVEVETDGKLIDCFPIELLPFGEQFV